MKITEIRNSASAVVEAKLFKPEPAQKKEAELITDKMDISLPSNNWQKDILLSALDMLESSIQTNEESHPLSKMENSPIDTFEEALIELNFIKSKKFLDEASGAQANIKAEDILSLFVEDAA